MKRLLRRVVAWWRLRNMPLRTQCRFCGCWLVDLFPEWNTKCPQCGRGSHDRRR